MDVLSTVGSLLGLPSLLLFPDFIQIPPFQLWE